MVDVDELSLDCATASLLDQKMFDLLLHSRVELLRSVRGHEREKHSQYLI